MSRREALLGESPLVRAHAEHLSALHGVLSMALLLRVEEELGVHDPEERLRRWPEINARVLDYMGRAATLTRGPVPTVSVL